MHYLVQTYSHLLFPDVPSRTTMISNDVDVGDGAPIKQDPYRLNPSKLEYLQKVIQNCSRMISLNLAGVTIQVLIRRGFIVLLQIADSQLLTHAY